MGTIRLEEPSYRDRSGSVFFAAGFRPFFLGAGLSAAIALPIWLAAYVGGIVLDAAVSPAVWHGHEMVFGFSAAAVAGFLLTAVPNWTGTRPASGAPLAALFFIWLAGRAAFSFNGLLPPALAAVIDLAFVPGLALLLAKPLISAGKWRNIAFLPILAVLMIMNALVHAEAVFDVQTGMIGVYGGITVLLLMITIVGGRIIPSFTQNWARMCGRVVEVQPLAWIEKGAAAGLLIAGMALVIFVPDNAATALVLTAAAAVHAIRAGRWHGKLSLNNPILWVLHLGYWWLPVGLLIAALSAATGVLPMSAAMHALTAGCVGTMIMAVMTRASLGHSGRPLEVSKPIVAAYVLLSLGTVLRVAAPLTGSGEMGLLHGGGTLWALAWVIFAVVYWPVMTRPRADGRPG